MAQGSAAEIRAALDVADAWGWKVETGQARAILDRLLGLLHGLTRDRRPRPAIAAPPTTGGSGA